MADSPLLDAPTCKSKVRDSTTRFTVTRTRITDERKRSSKTVVDENEKVKKRKKKRKKKKIYDPARRASSLGTRRMSRRRKKEYAVIGLATAWNKSFARFFLKKKKIRTIYLCSKIYSPFGFEGRKNNREKEGKKMRRERICIHVYATNERSFTCDRHRRHGANDPAIEYERSPRSRPSSVLSTRSKNNTPFDRSCVTAPPNAPSFSANLQIQRIVNTARFVNTGSSPASFLL